MNSSVQTPNHEDATGPTAPVASAARPEYPHTSPPLASWTRASWWRAIAFEVLAAIVAALSDATLAAPLLAVFLVAGSASDSGPGLSVLAWPVAFVMMLVMAYCAHCGAYYLQHETAAKNRVWGKLLLTVWLVGGISLAALRSVHSILMPPLMDPSLTPGTEEAAAAYENTLIMAHVSDGGLALLMLVFYLASGLVIMAQAKKLGNPQLGHMLRSLESRERAKRAWKKARNEALMFSGQMANRTEHIRYGLDREHENAIEQAQRLNQEGKEYSVLVQTQINPEPAKTMMTHAHHVTAETAPSTSIHPAEAGVS